MERPAEIIWFERIILATLALGVLQSWLAWPSLTALRSPAFILTTQILTLAVMVGLTLLVSRRRSNIARWILVVLFVIGLPIVAVQISGGLLRAGSLIISIVQLAGQLVAYVLLFTAGARRWFSRESVAA